MNGTEQRAHTTRTAELGKQFDDVTLVVQALAEQIVKDREDVAALRRSVGQLQMRTGLLADGLADAIRRFESMTLWQRLRWLVTGV